MASIIQTPKVTGRAASDRSTASDRSDRAEDAFGTYSTGSAKHAGTYVDHAAQPTAERPRHEEREALLTRVRELENEIHAMHASLNDLKAASERAGYEEGVARAEQQVAELQENARQECELLLANLRAAKIELIHQAEDAAIEIGFSLAAKIVGRVHTEGKLTTAQVKQAMRHVIDREAIVVFLSSVDYEKLHRHSRDPELGGAQLVVDETVEPGSCKLKSKAGTLEVRLESQLRKLIKAVVESREAQESNDRSKT